MRISALIYKSVFLLLVTFSLQLHAQTLPSWARDNNPERFEGAIRQFETQDRLNPPPKGAIVLTGSSSIARWNEHSR